VTHGQTVGARPGRRWHAGAGVFTAHRLCLCEFSFSAVRPVQLDHTHIACRLWRDEIRPGNGDAIWAIDFRSTVLEFPQTFERGEHGSDADVGTAAGQWKSGLRFRGEQQLPIM
jgi:hypothetical protein